MTIDPATAQTIVDNLKDVIEYNINFFDTEGTMVASTDASRIGSFHGAARQAAVDGQTVAVDRRHPYEGAQDGVNVPVVLNGAVVAVIGITGPVNRVRDLGGIIERMTGLMLCANMEQIARFNRRIMTSNLVNLLTLEHKDNELPWPWPLIWTCQVHGWLWSAGLQESGWKGSIRIGSTKNSARRVCPSGFPSSL